MKPLKEHYLRLLKKLILILESQSIELIVVGGAVRDFLIDGKFSKDVDLEISSVDRSKSVEEVFNLVFTSSKQCGYENVKRLPFNITQFTIDDYEFEISIGRLEKFIEKDLSHKNFDVEYCLDFDFDKKWRRRDITLNAIGLNLISGNIIDPFCGIEDIQNKLIRYIDIDFFRDPVRLLRLLRFKVALEFMIDEQIYSNIKKFNMSQCSFYYLFKEGEKVGLSNFFNEFLDLNKQDDNFFNLLKFKEDHVTLIRFAELASFDNLRELVFKSVKLKAESVSDVIKDNGLFSQKSYRKLRNFFNSSKTTRSERLKDISFIGDDFVEWAKNDC